MYTNRTSEGFTLIENIQSGDNFSNLLYTIKRNMQYFYPYFKTACKFTPNGRIKNTYFKSNGEATTQYLGGETYTEIWKLTGAQLSTVSSGEANPNTQTDFSKKYINLSNFAGNGKTRSRVAFVVENGSETDPPIYIDNIEFFLSENPDPVIPTEGRVILYPNPAIDLFHVAFNLSKYEDVTIQVLSSTGALIHEIIYPQTLNQTYSFSTELFSKGLFVLKISSNSLEETKKLIIN
jgi:hypothetical protein